MTENGKQKAAVAVGNSEVRNPADNPIAGAAGGPGRAGGADIVEALCRTEAVQSMKEFRQHRTTNTYDHCRHVAAVSLALDRRLHLGCNRVVLGRSAMLHDFYLYDWHEKSDSHRWHGFHHPRKAAGNAARYFNASEREQRIIASHMWPLTLRAVPPCKEAWVLCLADKYCTVLECLGLRTRHTQRYGQGNRKKRV